MSDQQSDTTTAAYAQGQSAGEAMHALMERLFPICRSITGDGVRQTLAMIGEIIPVDVHEVDSGTQCFDWVVPQEWNIRDAYVLDPSGQKILDFQENNLHVVGYSVPFSGRMDLGELKNHLYSDPNVPEAIPYITSYYEPRWGFCLSHDQLMGLEDGEYTAVVDSQLHDGSLTYGEVLIPGDHPDEILISTNVCHPSMANNELSGPVMATYLTQWILQRPKRHYSYRIAFVPETVGMLAYLSSRLETLRQRVVAGFHTVCVGGPADFTYIRSRRDDAMVDRVVSHVLRNLRLPYESQGFHLRGSDERQLCAPGIDLPIGVLTKSKFENYREYHTSLDDLDFVTGAQLDASFQVFTTCLELIERNHFYRATQLGEPNMGRRGMYPTVGGQAYRMDDVHKQMGLLAYADGEHDLMAIADLHEEPAWAFYDVLERLVNADLLVRVDSKAE